MGSVRALVFAGAVTLLSLPAARAADLPVLPPAPVIVEFSGWYLRGDIGITNQRVDGMYQRIEDVVAERFSYTHTWGSSPLLGIGVGYQFNSWLRGDFTAEYRFKANLHAQAVGDAGSVNNFHGSKSEFTGLFNVYADLGTWWNLTPFVGAGLGFSYNRIHDFYDVCGAGVCNGQVTAVADGTGTKWNFAWALHAGLAYKFSPTLAVELAYRYIHLGDAESGWFHNVDPALSVAPGPYQFYDLTSHDVKLGVRWMFAPEPVYAPPLMRKG